MNRDNTLTCAMKKEKKKKRSTLFRRLFSSAHRHYSTQNEKNYPSIYIENSSFIVSNGGKAVERKRWNYEKLISSFSSHHFLSLTLSLSTEHVCTRSSTNHHKYLTAPHDIQRTQT